MNERESALRVLLEVDKGVFLSDALLQVNDRQASAREEGLRLELAKGTLSHKLYLDYVLRNFSKIRLKKIHRPIYYILVMAIYQLAFLDRIPQPAIVDEAVKLAKKWGNKGSVGFVNGVLRSILRSGDGALEVKEKDPAKRLSISYSMPLGWVNYFLKNAKIEEVEDFLSACLDQAPLTIRAVGIKREDLQDRLKEEGFRPWPHPLADQGLILESGQGLFSSRPFKEGRLYVQDGGSQAVVQAFSQDKGGRSLDVCAAPGGKSFQLSEISSEVLACDSDPQRLKVLKENMARLGLKNIQVRTHDGTRPLRGEGTFSRVLVDAPCTGMGLIRRKPEIKYRVGLEDVKELAKIQVKILKNASSCLDKGGELVYSTCSILKEENEEVIRAFLDETPSFKACGQATRLWPHREGTDGFFIQKLVRKD